MSSIIVLKDYHIQKPWLLQKMPLYIFRKHSICPKRLDMFEKPWFSHNLYPKTCYHQVRQVKTNKTVMSTFGAFVHVCSYEGISQRGSEGARGDFCLPHVYMSSHKFLSDDVFPAAPGLQHQWPWQVFTFSSTVLQRELVIDHYMTGYCLIFCIHNSFFSSGGECTAGLVMNFKLSESYEDKRICPQNWF